MNTAATLPKPVDWDELFPGRFLKASDLKGKKVTVTIASVDLESLPSETGGEKIKGVVSFDKTQKQFALNKTNGLCLKAMFGREVQKWVGKRVTLFESLWNGETCVRVWGSPDIDEDRDVDVALPRRRPFKMTMHKTAGAVKAVEPTPATDDGRAAIEALESGFRLGKKKLAAVWAGVEADYEARGAEIPLAVSAKHDELLDALKE